MPNLFKDVNLIDIRTKYFGNFWQVRGIKGQFVPRKPKLVRGLRVIGSFEKSRVREIGGEIIELESRKSKGNKVWYEISRGSGNRGFEKSGFHCCIEIDTQLEDPVFQFHNHH